jgi:hypothetical protein
LECGTATPAFSRVSPDHQPLSGSPAAASKRDPKGLAMSKRKPKPKTKIARKSRAKPKQKKLNLKKTVKNVAKNLWLHLIELPEREREEVIAALGRAVAKKFKRKRKK